MTSREIFDLYAETQPAPTLEPGDVFVRKTIPRIVFCSSSFLDNLVARKSAQAKATLRERRANSSFCCPTAPTSIQLRWLSRSSRHISPGSEREPAMPYGKPTTKSATYTPKANAGTASAPRGMGSIKCKMLSGIERAHRFRVIRQENANPHGAEKYCHFSR